MQTVEKNPYDFLPTLDFFVALLSSVDPHEHSILLSKKDIPVKLIFSLLLVCALAGCTNQREQQGNEASAVGALRTISASQAIFLERDASQKYGTLGQLGKAGLIDAVLATGKKQGYLFKVTAGDAKGEQKGFLWSATASPAKPGKSGKRHFFVDQTGVIRVSKDAPANVKSPMLGG